MTMNNVPAVGEPRRDGRIRRLLTAVAGAAVAIMIGSGIVAMPASADTAVPPGTANAPETVSADPLPTVQINGVVWTQTIAGPWVYVGGEFTSARPAGAALGQQETPRQNFLRYDLATGVMDANYVLPFNGKVLDSALSPDGKTVYVAGSFTKVGTTDRFRLAALDAATGALLTTFTPGANASVNGLAVSKDAVWVTGVFTQINSSARTRIASLDARSGAVLPFTASLTGGLYPDGRSIVVSPDQKKIVVSGSFTMANGISNPGRGLAALDAVTGATKPWAMNSLIRNGDSKSSMMGLTSDGDSVYGSGYSFSGDGFEGSFRANWSDGELVWLDDCHGDTYDVAIAGDVLYKASHAHYCGNIGEFPQETPIFSNHGLAFSKNPSDRKITTDVFGYYSYTGQTAGRLLHWYPIFKEGTYTGQKQATWTVTAGSGYVLYGGEFPAAAGLAQQGIVRFATKDKAPNKMGPVVTGGAFAVNATSTNPGEARVTFAANYDPDNAQLRYELFRKGESAAISTLSAVSTRWVRPALTLVDATVTTGQTYEYRVRAVDPFGNATVSDWKSVKITDRKPDAYDAAIMDSAPKKYWPLDESSGTTGTEWVSGDDLTLTQATRVTGGPLVGTASRATSFSGSANSSAVSTTAETGIHNMTVEAWFKTTSTSGGRIVGFGNAKTGTSSQFDRHIYITGDGTLRFGVQWGNAKRSIASGAGFNDGQWHHVVGTVSPTGLTFTVDTVLVGQQYDVGNAGAYTGYWRVAGDSLAGWTGAGASALAGTVSNVAVYDRALTMDEIRAHWVASGRSSAVPAPPTDAYGAAVFERDPMLYWRLNEQSGSTAADSGAASLPGRYQFVGTDLQRGVAGAVSGGGSAVTLRPSKNWLGQWTDFQSVVATRETASLPTFAVEGWFKTTSTGGGRLFGFGNSAANTINASTTNYDRHVYMTPSGQLKFGVYDGGTVSITAPGTYNDGQWHHVLAQQLAGGTDVGMQLYVDGVKVASNTRATAKAFTGFWRVGTDSTWEGDPAWAGSIDEFAVYDSFFQPEEVAAHYELGRTGKLNVAPKAAFTSLMTDLTVAVDGTTSSDPEGAIASYNWSFGDGTTGTGATASHTYALPGTYTVMLSVTDAGGKSSTTAQQVVAVAPNQLPKAAFTSLGTGLNLSVDASTSSDPDGAIATYAWTFGDGATATGKTATHAYAMSGTYTVSLTVTDNRGGSAMATKQIAVLGPNVLPTAVFTSTTNGLDVTVDGRASKDPDGTIASYAWDFGDGTTGTGATATRTYAAAGTYTVKLTVTDDRGGTATTSGTVRAGVTEPVIASDAFERSATSAWGSADVGGAWTLSGGNAAFSVGAGAGSIALAPSQTRQSTLGAVSATSTLTTATFNTDQLAAGGVVSAQLNGRIVGSSTYSARVRFETGNVLRLYLLQGETPLGGGSYVLPGGYSANDDITVKLSVAGTAPTKLGVKVWRSSEPEPTTWQLQATDTTAALQAAGSVGIKASASSLSTVPTTTLKFRDYLVTDGSAVVAPGQPPVAAFQAATDGLQVNVDGSGSKDPDGTVTSYAWDFGNGQQATGATASTTYAAAGTYTVTLTVTDASGMTGSVKHDVTVSKPAEPGVLATDEFERDLTGSWGTADVGGPWSLAGGSAAFGVTGGRGVIALAPSWTRMADLKGISGKDTTITTTFASDVVPAGTGAASVTVAGRVVGASVYQSRVRFEPGGAVRLFILRDETALGGKSLVLPGTYQSGTELTLKLAVSGTNPTTVSAKLWPAGTPEPADWQLTATDTTTALQAAGTIGLRGSVSSAITNPQVQISFSSFLAVTPVQG